MLAIYLLTISFTFSVAIRLNPGFDSVYNIEMSMDQSDHRASMTAQVYLRRVQTDWVIGRVLSFDDHNDEYYQLDAEQKIELLDFPFLIVGKAGHQHSFHFGTKESVAVVDLKYIIAHKLVLPWELLDKMVAAANSRITMDVLDLMLKDCQTEVEGEDPLRFITNLQQCSMEESPTKLSTDSEYTTTVKLSERELVELKTTGNFIFVDADGKVESSLQEEVTVKFIEFKPIEGEIDLSKVDMNE